MSAHTLIKHSIRKWERLSKIKEEEFEIFSSTFNVIDSCALCNEFKLCKKCPIFTHTGVKGCATTPYAYAEQALNTNEFENWKVYCEQEVVFLEELLDTTEDFEVPNGENSIRQADEAMEELEEDLEAGES